jgi:hypothetical protein
MGMFLSIAPSHAEDALSEIGGRLAKHAVICADFTQSKSLRALTRPLVSRGRFVFVAEKGVLWQVREPFPTQAVIKKDALISWNNEGKPQRLGFEKNPIFRSLSRVILAVFSGNTNQLQETFQVESAVTRSNWRLVLTPRDKSFAAIIARIRASGDRFIDELRIEEGRGDQTVITFSGMNTESCLLDNAEKNYFSH